ncbi:MAG: sulfite exporter TauE/SafE family protein [Pseudomonadota bacterium]
MISDIDWALAAQFVGVLTAAGIFAGFVAGLFGIGGGFVVVPALLLVFSVFGVDPEMVTHVAIGTSLATIIVTSLRSVSAHHKRGAVDFAIIRDWTPGLVIGVIVGLILANFMDGRSLKWIFSIGVFLMGIHFIKPLYVPKPTEESRMPEGGALWSISSFLGGFSALLGIGGGTIAVLVMTACGRPIHRAIATAAGFGTVIALPGAIGFALLGLGESGLPVGSVGYVNIIAFAAITAMSFLTAPLGARAAHSLDAVALKRVFGVYLIVTSAVVLLNVISN